MEPLRALEEAYNRFSHDPSFKKQLARWLDTFAGRPTPLYLAANLSRHVGGARVYLKREDLLHGGAHKINNTLGQALLAKKMGKRRIIAETGAGQHGVATAMACAGLGLRAEAYMWSEDMDLQSVIGKEARKQILQTDGKLPKAVVACVGGGSNSIGIFHSFLHDLEVDLYGVEAGGESLSPGQNAAPLVAGREGVLHGMMTYVLQDEAGQVQTTWSISAGLDYPGVGPEHAFLMNAGRAKYVTVSDEEALDAFKNLSQLEGIMPALESAHAISHAMKLSKRLGTKDSIIVNLSGRGDKVVEIIAKHIPQ